MYTLSILHLNAYKYVNDRICLKDSILFLSYHKIRWKIFLILENPRDLRKFEAGEFETVINSSHKVISSICKVHVNVTNNFGR